MAKNYTVLKGPSYDLGALHMAGLEVLLDRAGGTLTYSEAEYQAVLARNGGKTMMVVHAEVLKEKGKDKPNQVCLTLVRRPPGNAELPA
jgi:hypothetical protein